MSDGPTTEVLQGHLARWQAGDESARNDLVGHAAGRLRRLTRELLGDFARLRAWLETDDVFQDAVIRLCRRLQTTTPTSLLHFFRLAAREIRCQLTDLVRHFYGPRGMGNFVQGSPEISSVEDMPGAELTDSTWEPEQLALWGEFHRCAGELPEEERAVFDLLWYQGLTNAEAARLLNVSSKTILKRWRQASFKLHQALGGQLPGV